MIEELKQRLKLSLLGTSLSTLAKVVQIARYGTDGNVSLQISMRDTLSMVSNLCEDVYQTLNKYKQTSAKSANKMQQAYKCWTENYEQQAKCLLKDIIEKSENMTKRCQSLENKCQEVSNNIWEIGNKVLKEKDEVEKQKNKTKTDNKELHQPMHSQKEVWDLYHKANAALNTIQAILKNISFHWSKFTTFCEGLTEESVTVQIQNLQKMDAVKCKYFWMCNEFMTNIMQYYGTWVALECVCVEANHGIDNARNEFKCYIARYPTEQEFKALMASVNSVLPSQMTTTIEAKAIEYSDN